MIDQSQRLGRALAGRYEIRQVLGRGGMATVYLAHDLKHDRPVALKVLQPELTQALGPERFLREIEIAARLRHPHILPLYDSGDADGLLYYVMPLVEGESLRDRLAREGQLPVDDAIRIAREVADALTYAHSHDVVHRDIKPENILLESGHAVIADFGIARAITAAGSERLTATGLAIGTPAYMSPEQVTGEGRIDGRADLYSLGCVLYEMLAGEPPYTGPTAQAILAKRLGEPAPSLRAARETVSDALGRVIARSLARAPADRFATAAAFAEALQDPSAGLTPAPRERRPSMLRRRPAVWIGLGVVGLLALPLAVYWLTAHAFRTVAPVVPESAAEAVAVLPFRVVGQDAEFWREGIVDMLSFNLEGVGGLRKVDPSTVITAWNRSVGEGREVGREPGLELARQLGARYAVIGSAVESRGSVVLTADVYDAREPALRGSARVSAPADSVLSLVNRLSVELVRNGLLPPEAELPVMNLSLVTTISVPALKAYLAGERLYRRARFAEAATEFRRAVELDSTFARALYRLAGAYAWTEDAVLSRHYAERAARFTDRLPERDRLLLRTPVGPAAIAYLEAFTTRYPDDPDGWTLLGDQYLHQGGVALYPSDAFREALGRAVNLFPHYGEAYVHLIEDAFARRDSARVGELIDAFDKLDPSRPCPYSAFYDLTWGDDAAKARALTQLEALSGEAESNCVQAPLLIPRAASDVLERLRMAKLDPRVPELDRFAALFRALQATVPHGQIAAARRLLAQAEQLPVTRVDGARFAVMLHLAGFPDAPAVARAAQLLRTEPHPLNLFWLGTLAAADARWDEVERKAGALEAQVRDPDAVWLRSQADTVAAEHAGAFARALRAHAAVRRGDSRRLSGFETILRQLPASVGWKTEHPAEYLRYDVGRALLEQGRPGDAERYFHSFYHFQPLFLTQAQFYLGRVYEALGQRERALSHYDRFVTWWRESDPELRPWWEQGRDALHRLTGERAASTPGN